MPWLGKRQIELMYRTESGACCEEFANLVPLVSDTVEDGPQCNKGLSLELQPVVGEQRRDSGTAGKSITYLYLGESSKWFESFLGVVTGEGG